MTRTVPPMASTMGGQMDEPKHLVRPMDDSKDASMVDAMDVPRGNVTDLPKVRGTQGCQS